jgi:hypothetical protein
MRGVVTGPSNFGTMRETLPPAAVALAPMIEAPSKGVSRISDSGYYRKLCRMNARSPIFRVFSSFVGQISNEPMDLAAGRYDLCQR